MRGGGNGKRGVLFPAPVTFERHPAAFSWKQLWTCSAPLGARSGLSDILSLCHSGAFFVFFFLFGCEWEGKSRWGCYCSNIICKLIQWALKIGVSLGAPVQFIDSYADRHYVSDNVSLKGSLFVCGKSWALEKDKMLNFIPLSLHSFLAGCHLYPCFCFLSEQFWKDTLSGLHLAINVCHSPVPYRKRVRQVRASCVRDEGVKAKVADRLALLICQCLVGVHVARCVWGELKTSTVFFPLWEHHTWIFPL